MTGCFQKHLTHDVRGLDDKQQKVGLVLGRNDAAAVKTGA